MSTRGGSNDPTFPLISTEAATTLNGAAPGTGEVVQRVSVAERTAANTFVDVTAAAPLHVVQTGTPALPTGAALDATLSAQSAKLPATLGQKAMTASMAVVVASDQSAVPVSGTVAVSNLPATQPVSVASLPLPAGASTEATLDARTGSLTETAPASDTASSGINGRLQRIAQRLTSLIGLLPVSLGQKNSAGSLSVVISSDQSPLPVTGSGGTQYAEDVASVGAESMTLAGAIRQDTPIGTTSADGDYANLKTDSVGRLWTNSSGVTQPVSGTVTANAGSGTQAVSAASLPLPAGASTDATLAAQSAKLPATLGQKAMAASLAVTVASDQSALPVSGTFYQATQPVSAASLPLPTGAATAANQASDQTLVGGVTETAPATDTASSGLNGRLQRIAQRLTSIIALLPPALGAGGGLKVDGSGTALPVSGTVTANAGTGTQAVSLAALPATFAEDAAHTSGDLGIMSLAVRNDAGSALAGTTGDYIPLTTDSTGALRVTGGAGGGGTQYTEDAVAAGAESLTLAGAIRQDTPASSTSADGDYANMKVDSVGRLWTNPSGVTQPVSAASLPLPAGAATEATLVAESAKLPATLGQKAMTASMAVVVASDQSAVPVSGTVNANAGTNLNTSALALDATVGTTNTEVGGLTETAPATDTASSGLNGRLQRIAQRLTSLIGLLPTALGSGGGLKVDGSGTALPVSGTVTANAGSGTLAVSAASLPLPTGAAPAAGSASIASGQVTPTASAATLLAARATRRSVTFLNGTNMTVYIGPATVSAANGFALPAGAGLTVQTAALLQNIVSTVTGLTGVVSYVESYD